MLFYFGKNILYLMICKTKMKLKLMGCLVGCWLVVGWLLVGCWLFVGCLSGCCSVDFEGLLAALPLHG